MIDELNLGYLFPYFFAAYNAEPPLTWAPSSENDNVQHLKDRDGNVVGFIKAVGNRWATSAGAKAGPESDARAFVERDLRDQLFRELKGYNNFCLDRSPNRAMAFSLTLTAYDLLIETVWAYASSRLLSFAARTEVLVPASDNPISSSAGVINPGTRVVGGFDIPALAFRPVGPDCEVARRSLELRAYACATATGSMITGDTAFGPGQASCLAIPSLAENDLNGTIDQLNANLVAFVDRYRCTD